MGLYRDFETQPPTPGVDPVDGLAPAWLSRPAGKAWLGAFGDQKDWLTELTKQAVKARCADVAPSDALPLIGAERQLVRGVTETEADFRARILAAWDLWQYGGTAYGLLRALVTAGYPGPVIQTQGSAQQFQLDSGGALVVQSLTPPMHLGGTPSELWSDFGIVIPKPWPARWGGVALADGTNEQKTFAAMVASWKPAHARCVKIVVQDGNLWGSGGLTWAGASLKWGQGTNTNWTPPVG
jgi:hypothetical protein